MWRAILRQHGDTLGVVGLALFGFDDRQMRRHGDLIGQLATGRNEGTGGVEIRRAFQPQTGPVAEFERLGEGIPGVRDCGLDRQHSQCAAQVVFRHAGDRLELGFQQPRQADIGLQERHRQIVGRRHVAAGNVEPAGGIDGDREDEVDGLFAGLVFGHRVGPAVAGRRERVFHRDRQLDHGRLDVQRDGTAAADRALKLGVDAFIARLAFAAGGVRQPILDEREVRGQALLSALRQWPEFHRQHDTCRRRRRPEFHARRRWQGRLGKFNAGGPGR